MIGRIAVHTVYVIIMIIMCYFIVSCIPVKINNEQINNNNNNNIYMHNICTHNTISNNTQQYHCYYSYTNYTAQINLTVQIIGRNERSPMLQK